MYTQTTYYVRDAQGNVMATYQMSHDTFTWKTSGIYGSSRVGEYHADKIINIDGSKPSNPLSADEFEFKRGHKRYELANHLGNVLVVVSEKRTLVCISGNQYYEADIISAQDYYPFGMLMKERSFSSAAYSWGFQGQEKDDEIAGIGNAISYKFRIQDTRLGRFFSVDPLSFKFAWNSAYAFSANRLIDGVELEGKEVVTIHGNGTASAAISISADVGLLIEAKTGAVYINGGGGLGIETNVSVTGQFSLTIFPSAQSYKDVIGWGYTYGLAGGEGVVASGNIVSTMDNKFTGICWTMGIGVGISPISISGYINYNEVRPLDKNDKQFAIGTLSDAFVELSFKLIDINSQINSLEVDNQNINEDIRNLSSQLNDGTLNSTSRNRLNTQIKVKKEKLGSNSNVIDSLKSDKEQLETIQGAIDGALKKLED